MGASRTILVSFGVADLLGLAAVFLIFRPGGSAGTAQAERGATAVGVASCDCATCHGRRQGDGAVVRQDELMLWQDPSTAAGAHGRAYAVLRERRSTAIAQRLGIGEASSAPMCLGCHATPAGPRGVRFQQNDGVGCESCH